jgi:hypothetical protein
MAIRNNARFTPYRNCNSSEGMKRAISSHISNGKSVEVLVGVLGMRNTTEDVRCIGHGFLGQSRPWRLCTPQIGRPSLNNLPLATVGITQSSRYELLYGYPTEIGQIRAIWVWRWAAREDPDYNLNTYYVS